jgi:hypothetical protein
MRLDYRDGLDLDLPREHAAQAGDDHDTLCPQRIRRRRRPRPLDPQPLHVDARPTHADVFDLALYPEGLHHLALQKTPTATRKPMMPLAIRTTRAARAISAHLLPLPAAIRDVLPAMQIG